MITKEAYLKHKDIIDAWANGKTIEVRGISYWREVKNPVFDLSVEYRIKPEPETIYKIVLGPDGYPERMNYSFSEKEMSDYMTEYPLSRFKKFVAVED